MESLQSFQQRAAYLWDINQDTVSHSQTDTVMSNPAEIYQSQVIHFAHRCWWTIHTTTPPPGGEDQESRHILKD